jgi:hypothetical protein
MGEDGISARRVISTENIPIQEQMVKQKAEEISLKVNIEITSSSGWLDEFRKCAGRLSCKTMSRKSESVIDEKLGAWKIGLLSSLLSLCHRKHMQMTVGCCFSNYSQTRHAFSALRGQDTVAVLICANMHGSEGIPLLVTGK